MRGKTILLCAATAMVVALSSAPRAQACVVCRFRVDCTRYGQDCYLVEYCASLRSPHGGANDCSLDPYAGCQEIGLCQVARLGLPLGLRPAPRLELGSWALLGCSSETLPGVGLADRSPASRPPSPGTSRG